MHMSTISLDTTTLATCWQLTLMNGTIIGFTDCDQALKIDDITYHISSSFNYSNIERNSSLTIDNLQIEGAISSDYISDQDILAGKYDEAKIKIFRVNYENPNQKKTTLMSGSIGKILISGNKFIATINGISEKTQQQIVDTFSPSCRAHFCDHLCKLQASDFTAQGRVTDVIIDKRKFTDNSLSMPKNYYKNGLITFVCGGNKGISIEVKASDVNEVELFLSAPYEINCGDKYHITAGCDKLFTTCANKFNNTINFRGEPHMPGTNKLLQSVERHI